MRQYSNDDLLKAKRNMQPRSKPRTPLYRDRYRTSGHYYFTASLAGTLQTSISEWQKRISVTKLYIHVIVHRNRFLLNNQPDVLIIPILFCYKTLHVSGIFSAHHQEFSTVHLELVSFMQVSDDRLEAVIKTCIKLTSAECTVENS